MTILIHLLKRLTDVIYFTVRAVLTVVWTADELSNDVDEAGAHHTENSLPTHHVVRLLAISVLQYVLLKDAVTRVEHLPNRHQNHAESCN